MMVCPIGSIMKDFSLGEVPAFFLVCQEWRIHPYPQRSNLAREIFAGEKRHYY